MTLFGKRASEDLIQIKMKSWGGPSCIVTGVLTHRGKVTCRHTGRGQLPTSQKKNLRLPETTWESWSSFFPKALRRNMTLLKPWLWTLGLKNCKSMRFCCSKPPTWWCFVRGAPRNQYRLPVKTLGRVQQTLRFISPKHILPSSLQKESYHHECVHTPQPKARVTQWFMTITEVSVSVYHVTQSWPTGLIKRIAVSMIQSTWSWIFPLLQGSCL